MSVIEEIAAERKRQIEVEGWTAEHNDQHTLSQMAKAACSYCESAAYSPLFCRIPGHAFAVPRRWPHDWSLDWWKPTTERCDLIKAAALIVAEVERLDRAALRALADDPL